MSRVNRLTDHRKSQAVAEDGTAIAYEDIGHGEPLVLLHGLTESSGSWHEGGYVEQFLQRRRRLIVVDGRGHGQSGKPHDHSAYSGRKLASDLAAVLDSAGVQHAALMGYSMGGVTAMATALYHPHRVTALICNGAHPFAEDLTPFRAAFHQGFEAWLIFLRNLVPDLSYATRRRIEANDLAAIRASLARDRPDVSAAFAGFQRPLLAIAGTLDPHFAQIREFAALARGEFLPLDGKNHVTAFLDTDTIVWAVDDFLTRTAPSIRMKADV